MTSWRLKMEFNYAVQLGQGGVNMFDGDMPPYDEGDSYEEHCKKESAPWRFV